MNNLFNDIPTTERTFIGANLNGEFSDGYEECHESGKIFVEMITNWLSDILVAEEDLSVEEYWLAFEEVCNVWAKKYFGISKGKLNINKETWWWDD
uniref:CSON007525 protein n=1 Tax=Culicoides sonorensis TaxID=179676 RepID=A0A336M1A9_CULSO